MKQLFAFLLFATLAFSQEVRPGKPIADCNGTAITTNCHVKAGADGTVSVMYTLLGPRTIGAGANQIPAAAAGNSGYITIVTDSSDCVTSGTGPMLCRSNGTAWAPLGGGGGSGTFVTLSGDATSTATGGATVVKGVNSVLFSSLATGIVKNTATTGVPSIAVGADIPAVGTSGQIPYNNGAGGFGADSGLAYNSSTKALGVIGSISSGQAGTGNGTVNLNGTTSGTAVIASNSDATAVTINKNVGITGSITSGQGGVAQGKVTLNGATSGSADLSVTATGGTLNLGSTNATVDSAGVITVTGCTGCGAGTGTVTSSGSPAIHQVSVFTTGTDIKGLTVPSADSLMYGTTAADPSFKALPTSGTNGCSGSADMLQWNNSTHAFACGSASAGSGTVTVVSAGSLTSTALVTGGGTTTLQTPAATATMDASGNINTPGSVTAAGGFSSSGPYASSGATQAKPAAPASGSLLGWFDSTDLIPEWENSSGTTIAVAVAPAASPTANQFVDNIGTNGVQHKRAIDAADLPATAVTAGSYTSTNITVDQQGRITAAASGTAVLMFSSAGTTPSSGFSFFGIFTAGAEYRVAMPMAKAGTAVSMSCKAGDFPGAGNTYDYYLRVNQADPASQIHCQMSGASQSTCQATGSNAWFKDQPLDIKVTSSTSAISTYHNCSVEYR